MYLSIWLGIVLTGGQTGCTPLQTNNPGAPQVVQSRPAAPSGQPQAPQSQGPRTGIRNPDYYQIPKVPPPGARVTYNSVNVKGPYIAMTFDDGPHPSFTPRLLNMLAERNIKATFYVVGKNAREYPALIRRILAEGHEIGNHTWDHKALSSLTPEKVAWELAETDKAVRDASGYQMRTMRPPYGATNIRVKQQCYDQFGYPTILWSVDPLDWKRPGASVVSSRIVSGAHNGAIILAHDIHEATVNAMPSAFDTLLSRGFRFVTVSQLLNMDTGPAPAAAPQSAPQPAPVVPQFQPAPQQPLMQSAVPQPIYQPAPNPGQIQPPQTGGIPFQGQ